jgi:hypothetical protein
MPKTWIRNNPAIINNHLVATRGLVIICDADGCRQEGEERLSLGLFAGYYCDPCWEKSGYRQEGREGFSELDAGETYEEEPDIGGLFE